MGLHCLMLDIQSNLLPLLWKVKNHFFLFYRLFLVAGFLWHQCDSVSPSRVRWPCLCSGVFSASVNLDCCKVRLVGILLLFVCWFGCCLFFPPMQKNEFCCMKLTVWLSMLNRLAKCCFCGQLLTICHASVCLAKTCGYPLGVHVAQQDRAENYLELNVEGGSEKHLFLCTSFGSGWMHLHSTAQYWAEFLTGGSWDIPSSPEGESFWHACSISRAEIYWYLWSVCLLSTLLG